MGKFHAARLNENDRINFTGCFDVDNEKSKAVSEQYKIKKYNSLDSIVDDIDGVCIAVPTLEHLTVASLFLKAKKAVLLEKPIAHDIESAEALVDISESNGTILQIGHSERFNPAFLAVEKGIVSPKFIETHRLAPFKGRGDDVAVILDLMVHDLDLIMAMTGSLPDKIEAAGVSVITDTIDIVNARLTFPGGCVANVTASRISVKEMRKLRVFQKSGYTSIDMATREAEQYIAVASDDDRYKQAPVFGRFNLPDGRAVVRNSVAIPDGDNLKFEIESFIGGIRGERDVAVSGRDGLNVLRVASEIEKLCQDYLKKI
jgi:predicted dehydrogenase